MSETWTGTIPDSNIPDILFFKKFCVVKVAYEKQKCIKSETIPSHICCFSSLCSCSLPFIPHAWRLCSFTIILSPTRQLLMHHSLDTLLLQKCLLYPLCYFTRKLNNIYLCFVSATYENFNDNFPPPVHLF